MTSPPPPATPGDSGVLRTAASRVGWLGLLYFASGAPNGIATQAVPLVYAAEGLDLAAIGLLAFVELPYILKFLWAPLVDRLGSRRLWAAGCQAALAGLLVALSFLPSDSVPPLAWAVLYGIVLVSATQDLAIDAYAVEAVPPEAVGPSNGIRVTAYRIALVVSGGWLAARSATFGWRPVWWIAAVAFGLLALASARAPSPPRRRAQRPPVLAPLKDFARRPGIVGFALFVLLFKVGDYLMSRMTKPCLLARGFTRAEIGDAVVPLEIGATILGALLGGLLTRRWGVFKALWVLGLLQAVSNLGYAAGAEAGKPALWAAAAIEPFCTGLGTAPFLSLFMVACRKNHAAVQFALLSAVMALGRVAAGASSGYLAKSLGFAPYFAWTFVAALPAFALLPWVRRFLREPHARPDPLTA